MDKVLRTRPRAFREFLNGTRRLEIRPSAGLQELHVGDRVDFHSGNRDKALFRIVSVRLYSSFVAALDTEDFRGAYPHVIRRDEALAILNELYEAIDAKSGVIVLELSRAR